MRVCNLVVFSAVIALHRCAELCASDSNRQNEREKTQMCIADCLDLQKPGSERMNKKQCSFNIQTGAVVGETCGEIFYPSGFKKKTIICQLQLIDNYTSFLYWKGCDYIYHAHAIQYEMKTNTVNVRPNNMQIFTKRIKEAKYFGIKNLMQVGSYGSYDDVNVSPANLSDIVADPKKMEIFVTQLVDIVHTYDFDGIYVYWKYPGCPASLTCSRIKDKDNIPPFFKELYERLLPTRKKIVFFTTAMWLGPSWCLETYLNVVAPYVEHIVLETSPQIDTDRNLAEPPYSFFKIKFCMGSFLEKPSPYAVKKTLITLPMETIRSRLVEPNKPAALNAKIEKQKWIGIPEICAAALDYSWKMDKNSGTQNLLSNKVDIMFMDDTDSMKVKMDYISEKNLGGVLIEGTAKDDQLGSCGCGRMVWLRTIAELLKGGNCDIKKCY